MTLILLFLVSVETIPLSFPAFLKQLKNKAPEARAGLLEDYLNQRGPLPLIEGNIVHFIAQADQALAITGDFNHWPAEGTPMVKIDNTNGYYYSTELHPAARIEYLFVQEDTHFKDPRNPQEASSIAGTYSQITMPQYQQPKEIIRDPFIPKGELQTFNIATQKGPLQIQVYLPNGYSPKKTYPHVYINDGQAFLELSRLKTILDNSIGKGKIPPLLAILHTAKDRHQEYGINNTYPKQVTTEVMPFIEKIFGKTTRHKRGIMGASRGALAALNLATKASEHFSFCATLAPVFNEKEGFQLLQTKTNVPIYFYVMGGLYDPMITQAQALAAQLQEQKRPLTYLELPEGHSHNTWRAKIDDALVAMLGSGK